MSNETNKQSICKKDFKNFITEDDILLMDPDYRYNYIEQNEINTFYYKNLYVF